MGPCIAKVFSSATNKIQRYTIYLFLWNSLHVSGGSSAHHQELKTVYTASGTLSKCPMLYIQFWAPDDGRRNRLKHVENFTEINKLCNVASGWLQLKIVTFQFVTVFVKGLWCTYKNTGSTWFGVALSSWRSVFGRSALGGAAIQRLRCLFRVQAGQRFVQRGIGQKTQR